MRGVRGVRVSAEVVNCMAMGDWMGDPDVTLGWGCEALRDGGKYAVGAELRWSGVGKSVPGEVGGVVSRGGAHPDTSTLDDAMLILPVVRVRPWRDPVGVGRA